MRFERPVTSVQPPLQQQRGWEFTLHPQRAFPHDRHSPSGFKQMVLVAPVPVHIGLELCLPEFLASCRGGGVPAPDVTVPEAAVNEAHGSEPTKHEIGGTRELAVVQAVPQTACVESPAKNDFGYSVLLPRIPAIMRERVALSTMSGILCASSTRLGGKLLPQASLARGRRK